MSVRCATRATATLYGTGYSVVTQVAYSNQYYNGSYIQTSYVETSTVEQAVATETQYGTACQTIYPSSRSTRSRAEETTSTQYLPTSTATYVMASTAAADQGGQVVLVTSVATMAATSVFVIYKTEKPAIAAPTATSTTQKSSSSSHAGPIAGGIVAAVVLIALLAVLAWFLRKRARRDRDTRALDDFFKDALNPGEGAMTDDATLGAAAAPFKRQSMRRKSSLVLDLEKEKNQSHSNDEDNWAALTRMSSIADDDRSETHRQRSLSRQSLNAISRGASIRSHGQDDTIMAAVASAGSVSVWDGISARPLAEEPETIHFPPAVVRSNSSLYQQDDYPRSTRQMSSRLSSRSADILSLISPGLGSPRSPSLINDTPSTFGVKNEEFFVPSLSSSPPLHPSSRSRSQHMSMSGLNGLPNTSGPASPVIPPQNVPERPKSALGIMAVPEEHHSDHQHQVAGLPLQQPFQWSPPTRSTPLRSRASIAGYGQYGAYSQWSPPLGPHRVGSNQTSPRPMIRPKISSEYPPSRYSHLDVINHFVEGEGATIAGEKVEVATNGPIHREMRPRSLSGSILMKAASSTKERKSVEVPAASAFGEHGDSSDPSTSRSLSQKTSVNTRISSLEQQYSEDDEERNLNQQSSSNSVAAYHEKMAFSVLDRTLALINGNSATQTFPEDTPKKTSFWQPQAWRTKAAT